MRRAVGLLAFTLLVVCCFGTPLDDYLAKPDPTYGWNIAGSIRGKNSGVEYTAYFMNLTSQSWLTPQDSSAHIWRHWVTIIVPDVIKLDTAFMFIDGGSNRDKMPTSVSQLNEIVSVVSQSVSVQLQQIPNEPIVFTAEGKSRSEDAAIAYTWKHFIEDPSNPEWLLRLPMVKAAVRALDAVDEFTATLPNVPKIRGYGIAGGSKRGWVTWLMGVVDKRVMTIVPIVLDILNMVPNLNHHWQAYGNWSFALKDYRNLGLMAYLNEPIFEELGAIVDPFSYRDRMLLPKYMINACGDEFFLPDSPQFFWSQMEGPKWMRMVPNAEHSIVGHLLDVTLSASTYYMRVARNEPLPEYSWVTETQDNKTWTITVTTDTQPAVVRMWHAYNPFARDFRLITNDDPVVVNPILWWEQKIQNSGTEGAYKYVASMDVPKSGYRGFLVELTYSYGKNVLGEQSLVVTTEAMIIPPELPYPPCGDKCA